MHPFQRRRHRTLWTLLIVLLPVLWLAAVAVTPERGDSLAESGELAVTAGLQQSADGVTSLLLRLDEPLRAPSILVYQGGSPATRGNQATLLGHITSRGEYQFPLLSPVTFPLTIVGYDPIHQNDVMSINLTQ